MNVFPPPRELRPSPFRSTMRVVGNLPACEGGVLRLHLIGHRERPGPDGTTLEGDLRPLALGVAFVKARDGYENVEPIHVYFQPGGARPAYLTLRSPTGEVVAIGELVLGSGDYSHSIRAGRSSVQLLGTPTRR